MPFEYSNSKQYLARLLANENINVARKSVSTAYFDLKTRTMVLPMWETSENVYDLLTIHEISHALHTPHEGWHDAVAVRDLPKSYLNIIEDARIERLINKKYAGTSRVMKLGYKELLEKDIFGLEKNNVDVEKLPLIDRINLFFKLGSNLYVPFSEEERHWLSKVEELETWEDVVKLCEELYTSEKEKYKESQTDNSNHETSETSEGFGEGDADNETIEEDEGFGEDVRTPSSTNEEVEEDDTKGESERQETENSSSFDPLDSITDNEYRSNMKEFEKSITKQTENNSYSFSIGKVNSDKYVVPARVFREKIKQNVRLHLGETAFGEGGAVISKLLKNHIPVVNNMIKEFESKKRADSISRQQYAKTGRLDAKKVHKYQTTEDIFRRNILTQEGKNHGMVMLFDWSGSMSDKLMETFEQTMILSLFCHKMDIPFKVCIFVDDYEKNQSLKTNQGVVIPYEIGRGVKLIEVLDSGCNKKTFYWDLFVFCCMCLKNNYKIRYRDYFQSNGIEFDNFVEDFMNSELVRNFQSLSGTPLNSALFLMDDYIKKFAKSNKTQINNLILMTDGDSHNNVELLGNAWRKELFVIDKITGKRYNYSHGKQTSWNVSRMYETNMLYDVLVNRNPDLNVIGLFVSDSKDVKERYRNLQSSESFSKPNKDGVYVVERNPLMCAHKYFLVNNKNLETENEWEINEDQQGNTTSVKRSFKNHMKKKKSSRVFVKLFIETIAKNI